nr:Uma2 family endonuclease [Effusibacillus pohliae]
MAIKREEVPKRPANYAEYLLTPEGERWEIIEGIPYNMTPAPSTEHQRIIGNLHGEFYSYLKGKPCSAFVAPFDVRLLADGKADDQVKNVVQPDISIICDPNKIDEKGCLGAPDLIVEVLSPSTAKKDRSEKLRLYRLAGVREYWIVDPLNKTVEVYDWTQHRFAEAQVYGAEDRIQVAIFDDLVIDLGDVF